MEQAAENAMPRSWLSLLTHRWHTSSRVVLVLSLLFLVFCNLPGQWVLILDPELDSFGVMQWHLEHGWPFTWLASREERAYDDDGKNVQIATAKYFDLWREGTELQGRWIAANLAIAVALSLIVGAAFEFWRRARKRIWHLHLSDIVAVTCVVALATFWCVQRMEFRAREIAVAQGPRANGSGLRIVAYQEGGISWLRNLLVDQHLRRLDLPYAVMVSDGADWSRLPDLSTVRVVGVEACPSTGDLTYLSKMPVLEVVENYVRPSPEPEQDWFAEFPPLLKVRELFLGGLARRIQRIDRLSSLEAVRLDGPMTDASVLREVANLPSLRSLSIDWLAEDADLSFLSRMPHLTQLSIHNSTLNQAMLQEIGRCRHLTELELNSCDWKDGELQALTNLKTLRKLYLFEAAIQGRAAFISELPELEVLELKGTDISGRDLQRLAGLTHLRDLDLRNCRFDDDYPPALRKLTQLKRLRIPFDCDEELADLPTTLPNCVVGLDPPPYRPRKISW